MDGSMTMSHRRTLARVAAGTALAGLFSATTPPAAGDAASRTPHGGGGRAVRAPTANDITEFTVPTPHATPLLIVTGSDGNLWFTEQAANKIGRLTPTGV